MRVIVTDQRYPMLISNGDVGTELTAVASTSSTGATPKNLQIMLFEKRDDLLFRNVGGDQKHACCWIGKGGKKSLDPQFEGLHLNTGDATITTFAAAVTAALNQLGAQHNIVTIKLRGRDWFHMDGTDVNYLLGALEDIGSSAQDGASRSTRDGDPWSAITALDDDDPGDIDR